MFRSFIQNASFIIDAARDGIANALWFAVSGTPAMSGATPNQFRFSGDEGLVRTDVKYGRYEFSTSFTSLGSGVSPAGLVGNIEFGLKNLSLGARGYIRVVAKTGDTNMYFETADRYGSAQSFAFPWKAAYTTDKAQWIIDWFDGKPMAKLSIVVADGRTQAQTSMRAGIFQVGETIVGSSPSNTAKVYSTGSNEIIFTILSGSFSAGDTITGSTSGATALLGVVNAMTKLEQICEIKQNFIPTVVLNPYVKSTSASDMFDVDYISVDNANQNSIMLV